MNVRKRLVLSLLAVQVPGLANGQVIFNDHGCGVRAARYVLETHGHLVSFAALYEELGASADRGVSVRAVSDCFRRRGLSVSVIEPPRLSTLVTKLSVIVYSDPPNEEATLGHFYVIESSNERDFSAWDGFVGLSDATRECLSAGTRKIYIIVATEQIDEPEKFFSSGVIYAAGVKLILFSVVCTFYRMKGSFDGGS